MNQETLHSETPKAPASTPPTSKPKGLDIEIPKITLPKGGGALKPIDEKFSVNASNGTASYSLPIPMPSGRGGTPPLSASYSSGGGNSVLGLGWSLDFPMIKLKTDRKLPEYLDQDIYLFAGAEDLVPVLVDHGMGLEREEFTALTGETVSRYRPRIEGGFTRIEKIRKPGAPAPYWKVTSPQNEVTFFGRTAASRIAEPGHPERVYAWLPDLGYDDKGNCVSYTYRPEDAVGVAPALHEQHRLSGLQPFTNLYLKEIKYGNEQPYLLGGANPYDPTEPANPGYFYSVVIDYGDHQSPEPVPTPDSPWPGRRDPYSDCKPGFEVRTYRQVWRILIFRTFKELSPSGIVEPTLTHSLDFEWVHAGKGAGMVEADMPLSVRLTNWRRKGANGYETASLPAMVFSYQSTDWDQSVHEVSEESAANLPTGLGNGYQLADLRNEGLPGVLTDQGGGWYFKRNLGNGLLGPALPVMERPNLGGLQEGVLQLQDLEGDGRKFLVYRGPELQGYWEEDLEGWQPFQHFTGWARVPSSPQAVKQIDLDGDGKPELLLHEEFAVLWFPNLGKEGYGPGRKADLSMDEDMGPQVLFQDAQQAVFLADMTGDGLTDIVQIGNGSVSYWPNMGYGKFGARVSMAEAPVFDHPDVFHPSYLNLSDVSGTGATDIVYLGGSTFKAWFNQCGNSWSAAVEIVNFPTMEQPNQVQVLDFLGKGTAAIVWSSSLPAQGHAPLRYIDLFGGTKPYLMVGYHNSYGKQVSWTYRSSTQYYLEDDAKGEPWITRLPFPVQCVSQSVVMDEVTGHRFSSSYTYHHGHYDYAEREFRGFGRVEQLDAETFEHFVRTGATNIVEADLHQPPVLSKTWFHTGAFLDRERILDQFAGEYHVPLGITAHKIPGPALPVDVDAETWREALRACKGMTLRQEVYALDGSPQESEPYSVTETGCHLDLVQPRKDGHAAVFLVKESENIVYHYERETSDPRIGHQVNLAFDDMGNVLSSASIMYGRQAVDLALPQAVRDAQAEVRITISTHAFTKDIITPSTYRLRMGWESQSWELSGVTPGGTYFTAEELLLQFAGATLKEYHEYPSWLGPEKRKIHHERSLYLSDNLSDVLPYGNHDKLGIRYQSYSLVLTEAVRQDAFGALVLAPELQAAGYTLSSDLQLAGLFPAEDAADDWWMRSGYLQYPANPALHYYRPDGYMDALGKVTKVYEYGNYHLFVAKTEDMLGNESQILEFDFRTQQSTRIQDMNGTQTALALDIYGFVSAIAVMGKLGEGENLSGIVPDLSPEQLDDFFADPVAHAAGILGNATTRYIYDLSRTRSSTMVAASIEREKHLHQMAPGEATVTYVHFQYSDGGGHMVMVKGQAEPGLALRINAQNELETVDTSPNLRWIGTGRTIVNNKGSVVKQYESFFSPSHAYESEMALVEIGFTAVHYYDPMGRNIRTELPDGTHSRQRFSPWKHTSYDPNDTVGESQWLLDRQPGGKFELDADKVSAAQKTLVHKDTPTVTHFDSLGRNIYVVAHNAWIDRTTQLRVEAFHEGYTKMDVEGNILEVHDARDNMVMQYKRSIAGGILFLHSMDAGDRWTLDDAMGKPYWHRDANGTVFRNVYDDLHRPLHQEITPQGGNMMIPRRVEYGEPLAGAGNYLRGKVVKQYDGAGTIEQQVYDFKGDAIQSLRKFTQDATSVPDWVVPGAVAMAPEDWVSTTEHNTGGMQIRSTTPDGSIFHSHYNEARLLKSVEVQLQGGAATPFITDIGYNEKGMRSHIHYANGVHTTYHYEPETLRLKQKVTTRKGGADRLQDLSYSFDAVGNICRIADQAQDTVFFNGAVVSATGDYTYDALYRLVRASGREHANGAIAVDAYDLPRRVMPMPGDGSAMRNYAQYYEYDKAGNMTRMSHTAGNGAFLHQWTRQFTNDGSSNRLLSSQVGAGPVESYTYDLHGNMTSMPHLQDLVWDHEDHLVRLNKAGGNADSDFNSAWYQYDSSGHRARKTVTHANGVTEQRLYLGALEVYVQSQPGKTLVRRDTVHVVDGSKRIAMVETTTVKNDAAVNIVRYRYQLDNHLGSAAMEVDETANANLISYEEYYPWGSSAYRTHNNDTEVSEQRYRYTGMERDEESGLCCHGVRYYAPWLARWTAADPAGIGGGNNLYAYVKGNPIGFSDSSGYEGEWYQLSLSQSRAYWQEVRATATGRGISDKVRENLFKAWTAWGGDPATKIDAGHISHGVEKPFGLTRAGEVSSVMAEPASINRSTGSTAEKALVQAERAAGRFARDANGVDTTVAKGTRFGQPPTNPNFASLPNPPAAPAAAAVPPAAPVAAPAPPAGGAAQPQQLELFGPKPTPPAAPAAAAGAADAAKAETAAAGAATAVADAGKVESGLAKAGAVASDVAKADKAVEEVVVASKVASGASRLSKVVKAVAPVAKALAPVAKVLAPVGRVVGKAAGPVGIGAGVLMIATAKDTEGKIDGGITAVSSALMMSKHPVAVAGGVGLMAGQAIEKTLDVSAYSSAVGVKAYEGLKNAGVNDTVSLVAGGVVTVAATVPAIGVAAVDKGISAGKSAIGWLRSKF